MILGLRRKHSAPSSTIHEEVSSRSMNPQQADIFGNADVLIKYVLEGHERGVNWASFHPTLPMIVSGADDRSVKTWRMSGSLCFFFVFHPFLHRHKSLGS